MNVQCVKIIDFGRHVIRIIIFKPNNITYAGMSLKPHTSFPNENYFFVNLLNFLFVHQYEMKLNYTVASFSFAIIIRRLCVIVII